MVVGSHLGMEHAKRSRAKRHVAGEGGPFSLLSYWGRGGGRLWLGLGPGQEALQGRSGSTWALGVPVSSTFAAL